MFSLITIRTHNFSLILTDKSNIDFEKGEIIDKNDIIELEFKPNSMIIIVKGKSKELSPFRKIKDNDEIIIKNKKYIVLHKIKY